MHALNTIAALPLRLGRFLWSVVHPTRTAGRIPLGRFTITVQLIAALIFVGYTLSKKSLRLPFSSQAYEVEVIFPDAQGLDRQDEPGVAVAGTLQGRVTEVRYEPAIGAAVATLSMEPDVEGKLFANASAAIRPGSAIQNLVVNVDPGDPAKGPLPEGEPIPQARTAPFVPIDDLTRVLDADTRAYVQILVSEAQSALHGRESELRASLREIGELTDTATPVARALATRRHLLTRLVGDLDEIFTVLGQRGNQLAAAIGAGNRTLGVTARHEAELTELTRRLRPTLVQADEALAAVNDLTPPLLVALRELVPAAPSLAAGLEATRSLIPPSSAMLEAFEDLVRDGSRPLRLMVEGSQGLAGRVRRQVPIARDLTDLSKRLDRYKAGMAQLADTLSGALSVNDSGGTYGQVDVITLERPKPENLGFPAAAARARGGHSRLELRLAAALERACSPRTPYACVVRLSLPGLPRAPVTGRGGGG